MAGKEFKFSLKEALKHGPVVLYFYPAAFTSGCTMEAHEFAEAADQYKALGATLIGVTAGNTNRLVEFSTSECRSKFADRGGDYRDHQGLRRGAGRLSGLVGPDVLCDRAVGEIIFTYSNPDPSKHVDETLGALKKWKDAHPS